MDLGTIKKRLQRKDYYKTLHQVGLDVRKIWSNCQEYNQEGSDFHKLAGSLRKKWDDKFTKLLAECRPTTSTNGHDDNDNNNNNNAARGDIATTGNKDSKKAAKNETSWSPLETSGTTTTTLANISSLMERKSFAKSLFHMSKEDLGKLLVEVEAKCPSALTRNATEDEVEFNVDKISQSLLMELNAFIKSSTQKPVKSSSSSNKKTSTTTTTTAATTTTTTTVSSNNNSMSGSGNANAAVPSSSNKRARTKSS